MAECNSITNDTFIHFAKTYDLDIIDEYDNTINMSANMKKVYLTLRELKNDRPFVVWSDCDIIFNKKLDPNFILNNSEQPITMLFSPAGFETSFFIVRNDPVVINIFEEWSKMDYASIHANKDEYGFATLIENNPWIKSIMTVIPSDYITNCNSNILGSIGKHFYYSSSANKRMSLFSINIYKKMFFELDKFNNIK